MNLYQKLAGVRGLAYAVKKNREGYGYNYADITDILAKVTAGMKKYNVSLIPTIVPGTMTATPVEIEKTKPDKTGRLITTKKLETQVNAEMIFKWVDDETGEFMEVPWVLVARQEDPSQAFGSALTYCTRYFLTSYFQIAQPETDVDTYITKQKQAEEAEAKAINEGILTEFDGIVKEFLLENSEKKDKVKEFITHYTKAKDKEGNPNYKKITNAAVSAKMLSDFKETFIKNTDEGKEE